MLRTASFILIACGCIILCVATVKYYRLLQYNRQEAYRKDFFSTRLHWFCLALMCFFIVGYTFGMIEVLLYPVDPIFGLIAAVFFFGGCFVYITISAQADMATMLRKKTIEMMKALVTAIEMKDSYTKGHSVHIYELMNIFYEHLPEDLRSRLNKPKLMDAALLHDIGKISISDDILNKTTRLSDEEWITIKTHPLNGKMMLDNTSFSEISNWVLYHHEHIDGNGYYGLKGDEIPLESKLISITDTYSALCTERIYRPKRTYEEAEKIMQEAAGIQLDEELLRYFFAIDQKELEKLVPVNPTFK